jgi:hypothetical protein
VNTMCPACSGLIKKGPDCPCGEKMLDSGPVTDYLGPYSPYFNTCFETPSCIHLFTCPACGRDIRVAVRLQEV